VSASADSIFRNRRLDRHSKFYAISDNLVFAGASRVPRNCFARSGLLGRLGLRVTDVNVFVCRSRRSVEREAVGFALMRQQVKAGRLKVAWMSEEEKAAYRLRKPPRPNRGGIYDAERAARHRAPAAIMGQGYPWHRDDHRGSVGFAGCGWSARSAANPPFPRGKPDSHEASEQSEGLASGSAAGAKAPRALVVGAPAAHVVAACLRLARGYRRAVWRR